jgi:hypothetical protein
MLALISLPVWGAEIRFVDTKLAPVEELSLAGTFRVVVTGVPETTGRATLLVLREGVLKAVEEVTLTRKGDLLQSDDIHALRPCDPPGTPSVSVQLGDTIAAVTGLGGGLSATARVGPRVRGEGDPRIVLQRWDEKPGVPGKWSPTDKVEPGVFQIVFTDASCDVTCERDPVPHKAEFAGEEFALPLSESARASGQFVAAFELIIEPKDHELWFRVMTVERVLLEEGPVPPGVYLEFGPEDMRRRAPLPSLEVQLPKDLAIPEGCVGQLRVEAPERPDEVRWFVEEVARGDEQTLSLRADTPPRTMKVVALVRKGPLWGRAETTVRFVPRMELSFVDAVTGVPATEPWPHTQSVRIRAENVTGAAPVVSVGKLGPDPRTKRITLEATTDPGVFVSRPLNPLADFDARMGGMLWVHFSDPPRCVELMDRLDLR